MSLLPAQAIPWLLLTISKLLLGRALKVSYLDAAADSAKTWEKHMFYRELDFAALGRCKRSQPAIFDWRTLDIHRRLR